MDLRAEKILVTGACGFVGSALVRRLVGMKCEVHALVSAQSDRWRLKDLSSDLHFHSGDITDRAFVKSCVQSIQPTVIYHLAAHGAYPHQNNPTQIMAVNVQGTLNLLEALEQVPYKLFVNTGSSSEYGFKSVPMREDDVLVPNSYYAVAKASQTLLCQHVAMSHKKPIVSLRLFSVYGPYEEPSRLIPTLARRCLRHEDLSMASKATVRDFVFINDVIDAYCSVDRLNNCGGQIINIGTGIQTSLEEVVKVMTAVTESKSKPIWNAFKDREWDSSLWVADAQKAKALLHWQAKVTLAQGFKQTADHYAQ